MIPWFAWIPIVAIVGGIVRSTITGIVKSTYQHRERMEMIRMGMHPDANQTVAHDPYEKSATLEEV